MNDLEKKPVEILDEFGPEESKSGKSSEERYNSYEKRLVKSFITIVVLLLITVGLLTCYFIVKDDKYSYTENSLVNYQVCLKENNYYSEKCLNEGMEYISNITDNIRIDYNYNAVYDQLVDHDYQYYVKTKLTIKKDDDTDKVLFSKEENLTETKTFVGDNNVVSITDTVEIPFTKYNNYVQDYLNKYSLITKANLKVSLYINDGSAKKEVSSVTIPLTEQTYGISKSEISNNTGQYVTPSSNPLQYVFLVLSGIGIVGLVILIVRFVNFLLASSNRPSKYQRKLREILLNYDRVIVSGKDNSLLNSKEKVFEVKNFLELLDVRDTIDKPIFYYKISEVKSEFYVQDEDVTYKYTMKESDFTD